MDFQPNSPEEIDHTYQRSECHQSTEVSSAGEGGARKGVEGGARKRVEWGRIQLHGYNNALPGEYMHRQIDCLKFKIINF